MIFLSPTSAQQEIRKNLRSWRVHQGLTQAGLARRSGVKLATLRKFEQKGQISLESFLKILMFLDQLKPVIEAIEYKMKYSSMKQLLKAQEMDDKLQKKRKNGWRS